MKCWNSAFNPQGSRLIIVVVQFGAVKIYVAAVEALWRKERQDETQFITKVDGFLSFIPHWMRTYVFARFLKISPCVWPNSGFWCCLCNTLRITLLNKQKDPYWGPVVQKYRLHIFSHNCPFSRPRAVWRCPDTFWCCPSLLALGRVRLCIFCA